jgi:hypothetical protein
VGPSVCQPRSFPLLGKLSIQKACQVAGVIGAYSQYTAILQMDDDAIPAPQVPDPTAPDAVMNAPAFEEQRPPDFDPFDVIVAQRPLEQG